MHCSTSVVEKSKDKHRAPEWLMLNQRAILSDTATNFDLIFMYLMMKHYSIYFINISLTEKKTNDK